MKTLIFLILIGMVVGGHLLGKPRKTKKTEHYVAPRFIQEILVKEGHMLAENMTPQKDGDDDLLDFESVEEEQKRLEEKEKKKLQEYFRRNYDPAWDEGREELA